MKQQNQPLLYLAITCLLLFSCNLDPKKKVLQADREAPLGWVYLTVYEDSSFIFTSNGLRSETVYPGDMHMRGDTIFFHYHDAVPKAGMKALLGKKVVSFLDGEYPEQLNISMNELTH